MLDDTKATINRRGVSQSKQQPTSFVFNGKSIAMLEPSEEYTLGMQSKNHQCTESRAKLVEAHIGLAITIASKMRRYARTSDDLEQYKSEAYIGLCRAAEKFDPEKGFRFATYAIWCARSTVRDYILRNNNIIKLPTSGSLRNAFFHLNRIESKLRDGDPEISDFEVDARIAEELDLGISEVQDLRMFKRGSYSFNAPMNGNDGEQGADFIDQLPDDADHVKRIEEAEDLGIKREWLKVAMQGLDERQKYILTQRRLVDEPKKLEELGQEYRLSKERIRQIEAQAYSKTKKKMEIMARQYFAIPTPLKAGDCPKIAL